MDAELLEILREQLRIAIDFMEATNDGIPHHDALWWAGPMPAVPELYYPSDWEVANNPIWHIWDEYLSELKSAGLDDYLEKARALPISELLVPSSYWAE